MPKTPKSSTPSFVGRVVRKLSSSRKAHPHRFVFEPKKLLIDTEERWRPEHIVLEFRHRHRQFRSKMRSLEDSCSVGNRCVIVWPENVANDPIEFVTTLYNRRKQCNEFDDKEWSLVVEGSSTKAPVARPLAIAELNMRELIGPTDCVAEVRLELRPLHKGVLFCSLDFVVHYFPNTAETEPISHNSPPGSSAETELINHHLRLEEEKEQLSRRQDILNAQLDFNETEQRIDQLRTKIGAEEVVDNGGGDSNCNDTESVTPAETELINLHHRVVEEKEQLSHRQDILNAQLDLNETEQRIDQLHTKIDAEEVVDNGGGHSNSNGIAPVANGSPSPFYAALKHQKVSALLLQLKQQIDHKQQQGQVNKKVDDDTAAAAASAAMAYSERARELAARLAQCVRQISEVEQQDIFVGERMLEMAPGSPAETELINHHLRLVEEKEQLSRRQDILNAQLDLNETEQRIDQLRTKIGAEEVVDNGGGHSNSNDTAPVANGSSSPFYAALKHQKASELLLELKQQIDHKNDLVMQITDYEDEA